MRRFPFLSAFFMGGQAFCVYMKRATRITPESAGEKTLGRLFALLHSLARMKPIDSLRHKHISVYHVILKIILPDGGLPLTSNESTSKMICRVQMTWGPGDAPAAAPSASRGGGGGLVTAEDVVLPPQSDSWMKAAVQQELMREQMQHEQPQHFQQQQQQPQQQQPYQQQSDGGVGGGDAGVVDPSQQPLLNAQVRRFLAWSIVSFPRFLVSFSLLFYASNVLGTEWGDTECAVFAFVDVHFILPVATTDIFQHCTCSLRV